MADGIDRTLAERRELADLRAALAGVRAGLDAPGLTPAERLEAIRGVIEATWLDEAGVEAVLDAVVASVCQPEPWPFTETDVEALRKINQERQAIWQKTTGE